MADSEKEKKIQFCKNVLREALGYVRYNMLQIYRTVFCKIVKYWNSNFQKSNVCTENDELKNKQYVIIVQTFISLKILFCLNMSTKQLFWQFSYATAKGNVPMHQCN